MADLVKNILVVMGGPESPAGTLASLDTVVPIRSMPGLDTGVTKQQDPAILGSRAPIGQYVLQRDLSGPLPLAFRACKAVGKFLKSAMGTESTPAQVGACVRIRYTGADASCKIIADTSGNTLTSDVGALGAESGDATFGTAGVINLSSASFDTVGELVAAIAAYAAYDCEKVWGLDSVLSADVISVAAVQAKGKWAYLWFTSASSGAYMRQFTVDLTNAQHPVYTVQTEGFEINRKNSGNVADSVMINGALAGFAEMDVNLLGFVEDDTAYVSGLDINDLELRQPFIFQDGESTVGVDKITTISSLKMNVDNKHDKSTYGQGTLDRAYQKKGNIEITLDIQMMLDSSTKAYRTKKFDGSTMAISFYYKGKLIGVSSMYEALLVELPYVNISDFKFAERNAAIDAQVKGLALNPGGGNYDLMATITMVSQDSGAF